MKYNDIFGTKWIIIMFTIMPRLSRDPPVTRGWTYSFLRADFLFSSLSSWAASLSLTSDPGALAGIMSSCSSLLCKGHSGFYSAHNRRDSPSNKVAHLPFFWFQRQTRFKKLRTSQQTRESCLHKAHQFCFIAASFCCLFQFIKLSSCFV